eukprot:399679-Prymnesium_polylepis.1
METRLAGGAKLLGEQAVGELRWWQEMLGRELPRRGVPLAVRSAFPEPADPGVDLGVLVPYSDASREQTDSASGFVAWAIVLGEFVYVEGRWTEEKVRRLDINTLELAAMNIG